MKSKVWTIFVFTLLFVSKSHAQSVELINSGDVLEKAEKADDDGKYKDAVDLYSKISRSDTNYSQALQGLALASFRDSNFAACKKYAAIGLKLFPEETNTWYNLLSIGSENNDEGRKYDDSIIMNDSNDYVAWFNKAIKFYNEKKYTESEKYFERSVLIYPYYSPAHYFLGVAKFEEGELPQAMMSLSLNLLLDPSNKYSQNAVKMLSNICSVTDETSANAAKAVFGNDDNFDLQQQIILSKISLDRKYKLQSTLEDPITRQLQVLLEKLQYDKNDQGFWMQYYVPFFTNIFSQGKFNDMVNVMFDGLDIKSVQEYNKKNKKDIEALIVIAVDYFNKIKETQKLDPDERNTTGKRFYYSGKSIAGYGAWRNDGKKDIFSGPWKFYYKSGRLKSEGSFNDNEQNEGLWTYYYESGIKKEKLTYTDDKMNGIDSFWFDNGNISSVGKYINGDPADSVQLFYYNGFLKMVSHYSNAKKNGREVNYKSDGTINYIGNYTNDKPDGPIKYFYPDGQTASTGIYKNGDLDQAFKKYDEKGNLIMEGSYNAGKETGEWKEYYASSKIKKDYTFDNGNLQGNYKEYYENGLLQDDENYNSGKEEGLQTAYDEDGKKISESVFEKGRLRELRFYDKSGNVISSSSTRNGAGNFAFFDAQGNKASEGYFTKDGMRDGKSVFYFQNGKISSEENYKNGNLEGDKVQYFSNGVTYDKVNYKNDLADGYYTAFHENNVLSSEGWYVTGDKEQQFIDYNALKNVIEKSYYNDGSRDGYTEYYYPNGKEEYEQLFSAGWLTKITQFDTAGKTVGEFTLKQGNTDFAFTYPNGKPYLKGSYRHYNLSGPYDRFYFDGSPISHANYVYGDLDGNYTEYYYGGKIHFQGNYKAGKKEGEWKYYYQNGQLEYAENYIDGEQTGKEIIYEDDKTIIREKNYKHDMLEGDLKIYGENNQLAYVLYYHKNILLGYSYEGKDGKLVDTIRLKNSTGTLVAYYKNGTKSAEVNYENNLINGKRYLYFSNGKPYVENTKLLDDDNGIKKVYYPNGQLSSEENYLDGNNHGIEKDYYQNGKLKSEENWYNGMLNGTCRYYDETGKLTKTRFYYYDLLLSVN